MFKGTGTAVITPFNSDKSVDYHSLKLIVRDQIEGGISALVVLGTTGEAAVINDDERKKIIETVMEEAGGRVKIIIGTGTNDTMKTVKLNAMAELLKADGLLIVNPYYNKSTQNGIVEHYRYICERTTLPVMLYNVPSRTSMNMLPETVLKIADACKNVVALKEACGDISQIARLMSMIPDGFKVFSGNDDQTIPMMSLGAQGVISVFSNAFPGIMSSITSLMLEGRYEESLQLHNRYLKMMNLLFVEANPIPVKYLCSVRGLCSNILRLPLVPATPSVEKALLDEYNLLKGM